MRVQELTGALLDCWVARAEGMEAEVRSYQQDPFGKGVETVHYCSLLKNKRPFSPSTNWAQGGPIIERERMTFATTGTGPRGENGFEPVVAITYTGSRAMEGPNHLVAAMRAYVASKFGLAVPEEVAT